ncbi:MAG: murein biosynthesis integral membrane protein MurJ [Bdellovibrionota bacterium]|nr:murein biosynthesis integral membrane protein MurJ [Bdellovibrionota bacterium]
MKKVQGSSSVLFSAIKMALGTLGSRVLGLVRDILVAASFSTVITDAWLVAFRIPNLFRRLFGEGALTLSFLPILVKTRESGGPEAEKQLVNQLFSFLFLLLGLFSFVCLVFAPQILHLIAGGEAFTSIAGKMAYSIRFLRIMSFFLLFICMFAFFMALLNSRKKFFGAAIAPAFLNIALIVACLLPQSLFEVPGESLSWMALIGGFLQMAILIPSIKKLGLIPKLQTYVFSPEVKRVFKNSTPAFLSMGVLQITNMVNVYFASTIENGANSWIYYADRLLELPLSLIAVSFASALLPSLSEYWAKNDHEKFSLEFQKQLQFTIFLALPAGVGLFLLGEDLVRLIFQRGEFTAYSALQTASVVKIYAFSLLIFASVRIVNVCFYASQKVWLPIWGTVASLVLHLSIVSYFVESFGVQGLAISTAISGGFNLVIQFFIYQREFKGFRWLLFCKAILKSSTAALSMAAFILLYFRFIEDGLIMNSRWNVLALILCCVIVYFIAAMILGTDELQKLKKRLRKKRLRN